MYSLACLLYQCLTARTPFPGQDLPALMYAHLHEKPPAPSAAEAGVPPALDAVIATGMAKRPDDRYATAGDLAEAAYGATAPSGPAYSSRSTGFRPASNGRPARSALSSRSPADVTSSSTHVATGAAGADSADSGPGVNGSSDGTTLPDGAAAAGKGRGESVAPAPSSPPSTLSDPAKPGASREIPATDPSTAAQTDIACAVGPPAPPRPQRWSWARRHPRRVALAATAVIAVVLLGGAAITFTAHHTQTAGSANLGSAGPANPAPPPATVPASLAVPNRTASIPAPPAPGFVAIAPGGQFAWVTSLSARTVTVLDLATKSQVASIPIPQAPPRFVAFSADGSRAFVSAYTDDDGVNIVAMIDTRAAAVTTTIPVDRRPYALAVSPDQRTLWVPSHDTAQIDLINIASASITRRVQVAPNPHWVAFDAGRAYVTDHESNLVTVLDAGTAAQVAIIPVGPSPHSLAVSPDGSRIAVAVYDGNQLAIIDPKANRVTTTIGVGVHPQYVSWAPDGQHIYTANVDSGTVSVIDATMNQVSATVPVGRSPTSVVTIWPPGTSAVVSLLDDSQLAFMTVGR